MAHAKTIAEFIPSVEEALLYKRKWMQSGGRDYATYIDLLRTFKEPPVSIDVLTRQCELIYKAYNQRAAIERRSISANYLLTIDNLTERLSDGDLSLPDNIINGNIGDQFVFAVMFCHHSNPNVYFGCSDIIMNIIVALNKFDHFWNQELNNVVLRKYTIFHSVMNAFVRYYHLECLSHLELDILLRKASEKIMEEKQ